MTASVTTRIQLLYMWPSAARVIQDRRSCWLYRSCVRLCCSARSAFNLASEIFRSSRRADSQVCQFQCALPVVMIRLRDRHVPLQVANIHIQVTVTLDASNAPCIDSCWSMPYASNSRSCFQHLLCQHRRPKIHARVQKLQIVIADLTAARERPSASFEHSSSPRSERWKWCKT